MALDRTLVQQGLRERRRDRLPCCMSIVHSLYQFDLSHNLLQKTPLFGIMHLKSSIAGVAVIPAKDKAAIIRGPVENLGSG
jgi:hypothetical protein